MTVVVMFRYPLLITAVCKFCTAY